MALEHAQMAVQEGVRAVLLRLGFANEDAVPGLPARPPFNPNRRWWNNLESQPRMFRGFPPGGPWECFPANCTVLVNDFNAPLTAEALAQITGAMMVRLEDDDEGFGIHLPLIAQFWNRHPPHKIEVYYGVLVPAQVDDYEEPEE